MVSWEQGYVNTWGKKVFPINGAGEIKQLRAKEIDFLVPYTKNKLKMD